jgi:hypothetical protein
MAISLELGELVRAFRQHLAAQVQSAQIRVRTETMQRYRVQIGLDFLKNMYAAGLHTKVSAIDGEIFKKYLTWRQAVIAAKRENGTTRRDVVRDELIVIRKMFRYAVSQKLCTERQVPVWDFAVEKQAAIRRRITNNDIKDFMETVASWKQEARNPTEQYLRVLRALSYRDHVGASAPGSDAGRLVALQRIGRRREGRCYSWQQRRDEYTLPRARPV